MTNVDMTNNEPAYLPSGDQELVATLNRTVKLVLDSGEAKSLAEAQRLFEGYKLTVCVGPDVARSATHQAAHLTIVNTARRCFLGGVDVVDCPDAPLQIPWKRCCSLRDAVEDLQGSLTAQRTIGVPLILLGNADLRPAEHDDFAVRVTWNGWRGGVTPLSRDRRLPEAQECTPAGVMAGALAVSEAFQCVRGSNVQAGRRSVGMSLWKPEQSEDWLSESDFGPDLEWLPNKLWLVGLGHLGQAYLWTLGLLPYARPQTVELVLQDFDVLTVANDSTSPLTNLTMVGKKKTRAMAEWCEERGFRTTIQERQFDGNFHVRPDEPPVLLCGVDNEAARAMLDEVGFDEVIEAGLGKGKEEYLGFQLHMFPSAKTARQHWGNGSVDGAADALVSLPAYQKLAEEGLDDCGLTQLAGRSVGASFVGTFASTLVVAELLRMALGVHRYTVLDGSLRNLERRQSFSRPDKVQLTNPGVTEARK